MDAATLVGFVLVSTVGIATPGPDVLLAIRNGSRYGVQRAVVGIAGVALSDLVIMASVAFGLGAVLAASELFYLAVKLLGVLYLTYLGVRLLLTQAIPSSDATVSSAFVRHDWSLDIFARSFFVAFTNIKVWLFLVAFLPQFVDGTQPQIPQYMTLALVFEALNVVILLVYASLGAAAIRLFKSSTAVWIDRSSGAALLVLAVALMLHQN
jgi:threonine/homoserine/homoserine lactone efflux protein